MDIEAYLHNEQRNAGPSEFNTLENVPERD